MWITSYTERGIYNRLLEQMSVALRYDKGGLAAVLIWVNIVYKSA